MRRALLLRLSGEIFTKSPSTRRALIRSLERDLEHKFKRYQVRASIEHRDNRFLISPPPEPLPTALKILISQPGVNAITPAFIVYHDKLDSLLSELREVLEKLITFLSPFKLLVFWEKMSSDKERLIEFKESLLRKIPPPKTPSTVELDVRLEHKLVNGTHEVLAYIRSHELKGLGGLPTVPEEAPIGVLVSEGPDSLVAGIMLARRGVKLVLIHLATYEPSEDALESLALLKLVQPQARALIGYNWSSVLEELSSSGPKRELCMRCKTSMMRVGADVMREVTGEDRLAIATGEIVGEQASQTLNAMHSTWLSDPNVVILKPLSGFTKEDVYRFLKQVGFYEALASRAHKRCPFAPDNPRTKTRRRQRGINLKDARRLGFRLGSTDELPEVLDKVVLPREDTLQILTFLREAFPHHK